MDEQNNQFNQAPQGQQYAQQGTYQQYSAPQQPQYAPPPPQYTQPAYDPANRIVTVGDWIVTFILSGIPVVGLIMLIVWLVSSNTPKSKKNYLIAGIIWGIIVSVLTGIIVGIMAILGVSLPSLIENYI